MSSIGEFNATDMTRSIPSFEDWLTGTSAGDAHFQSLRGHHNMGAEEFDLITMDSMALNNAALDADLSTYMDHYATSSWDSIQGNSARHTLHTPFAMPESSSLPIEASAMNVGMESPQSSDILLRMPSLLKETPRRSLDPPIIEEDTYYAIMTSMKEYMPITAEMDPVLSLQDMQQYMKCYLVCFHRHCPVIHLPSLDLRAVPGLVLAMCAIGALYRLRRKTAHDLWQCASNICEKVCRMEIHTSSLTY